MSWASHDSVSKGIGMRRTVSQLIAIPLGLGMALGVLYLYSYCNSGPLPDSRVVEANGWELAVPDDVVTSTRAEFAVRPNDTPEPCFNLEIESTEFVPIGCVETGEWIRWSNQREFQPGEYYVRVTSSGERDILVETTIMVDHGEDVPEGPPHGRGFDLDAARNFEDFQIFWLGEEFRGIPIRVFYEGTDSVFFQYGTCRIVGGNEGCRIPLSVEVSDCRPDFREDVAIFSVRGAPAERINERITVWTGDSTVVIYAMSDKQAIEAADALVALTPGGPTKPSEDLPPSTCMEAPSGRNAEPTRLECIGPEDGQIRDEAVTFAAILTTADGEPLSGMPIIWTDDPEPFGPIDDTSTMDDDGMATTVYSVPADQGVERDGFVVAEFEGSEEYAAASCRTEFRVVSSAMPTPTGAAGQ